MIAKDELCKKITSLFPDIGECGIDLTVDYDDGTHAWVVDLRKGVSHLKTHLEIEEADLCMAGKQCVSLGIQIAQLKANLKDMPNFE